ncbi:hypothetical protein NL676_002237 [Syzygium grande]|nr:hypothetical protein NL676_002237 [Syzygium grande]
MQDPKTGGASRKRRGIKEGYRGIEGDGRITERHAPPPPPSCSTSGQDKKERNPRTPFLHAGAYENRKPPQASAAWWSRNGGGELRNRYASLH